MITDVEVADPGSISQVVTGSPQTPVSHLTYPVAGVPAHPVTVIVAEPHAVPSACNVFVGPVGSPSVASVKPVPETDQV